MREENVNSPLYQYDAGGGEKVWIGKPQVESGWQYLKELDEQYRSAAWQAGLDLSQLNLDGTHTAAKKGANRPKPATRHGGRGHGGGRAPNRRPGGVPGAECGGPGRLLSLWTSWTCTVCRP